MVRAQAKECIILERLILDLGTNFGFKCIKTTLFYKILFLETF